MSKTSVRIGAHVSAAGGVEQALERAVAIGCQTLQIFSGSPRVWAKRPLAQINPDKITSKAEKLGLGPIFTHAIYLTNAASDKPELQAKTRDTLIYDLQFDALLQGGGVVVHLGSTKQHDFAAVRDQVVEIIKAVLAATPDNSHLLIENAAGQDGKIGGNLEEIKWLLDQVHSPRLGWCLDSCHAFASGYWLGDAVPAENGRRAAKEPLLSAIDRLDLWSDLKLIHINGSRDIFGSGRDRHANLGEGYLTLTDLQQFLADPRVQTRPLIIEVPGDTGEGPDKANVDRLRQCVLTSKSRRNQSQ